MTTPNPYRGFRFPAEVIEHAVRLYHCFSLGLRDVELILAARVMVVSYDSIREWGLRFGRLFANALVPHGSVPCAEPRARWPVSCRRGRLALQLHSDVDA